MQEAHGLTAQPIDFVLSAGDAASRKTPSLPQAVIGVRPVRMKPIVLALVKAFMNSEYQTRIFPGSPSAILIPVTASDVRDEGLTKVGTTNTYIPVNNGA